jgi:hypothetical protein
MIASRDPDRAGDWRASDGLDLPGPAGVPGPGGRGGRCGRGDGEERAAPTSGGIAQARRRVGPEPMRELFSLAARAAATSIPGAVAADEHRRDDPRIPPRTGTRSARSYPRTGTPVARSRCARAGQPYRVRTACMVETCLPGRYTIRAGLACGREGRSPRRWAAPACRYRAAVVCEAWNRSAARRTGGCRERFASVSKAGVPVWRGPGPRGSGPGTRTDRRG